jgi:hypothetical protein
VGFTRFDAGLRRSLTAHAEPLKSTTFPSTQIRSPIVLDPRSGI